jgi:hypothetical protein
MNDMVENPLFSAGDCLDPADDKRAGRNGKFDRNEVK